MHNSVYSFMIIFSALILVSIPMCVMALYDSDEVSFGFKIMLLITMILGFVLMFLGMVVGDLIFVKEDALQ